MGRCYRAQDSSQIFRCDAKQNISPWVQSRLQPVCSLCWASSTTTFEELHTWTWYRNSFCRCLCLVVLWCQAFNYEWLYNVSHTQVIVSSKGMLRTTVKIIYIYPSELDVYVSSNPLLNEVFILKGCLPMFTPGRWGPPRLRVWIYILYNCVPQGEQCPGLCICSLQICPLCLNHFHLYADFYSPLSPDVLLFRLSLHTVHPAHCCQIVFQLSFHYIPLKTFFASS